MHTSKPRHKPPALFYWAVTMAFTCGCGDDSSSGSTTEVCEPGSTVPCVCSDGQRSRMMCLDDGSGYGDCACQPPSRPLPDMNAEDAASDGPQEGEDSESPAPPDAESDPQPTDASGDRNDNEDPQPIDQTAPSDPEDQPDLVEATLGLGADCTRAGECQSDICLAFSVGGTPQAVCTTPCCHEEECPYGFGCLQLEASRYCLPARIFPVGYSFTAPTGGSCGIGGNHCKSGICELSNDLCRGTCCTDSDCLAAPCHWSAIGSALRTYCDPMALLSGDGRSGSLCYSEYDCRSGVCVYNSQAGYYQCGDLCCSNGQCPTGTTCGLVAGPTYDSVVRACVPRPPGDLTDGAACSSDNQCASGTCIEEACRRICCLDRNCVAPMRCLPLITPEGVLATVCVDPNDY